MADISKRVAIIFKDPLNEKHVAVDITWLIANGVPTSKSGKPWLFQTMELVQ